MSISDTIDQVKLPDGFTKWESNILIVFFADYMRSQGVYDNVLFNVIGKQVSDYGDT